MAVGGFMKVRFVVIVVLGVIVAGTCALTPAQAAQISSLDRERAQQMLKTTVEEVRKHYYDPKFHGVDLNKEYSEAKQRIEKVSTLSMAIANIANLLDALNDSHTFFLPPERPMRFDYGWQYQMVGDRCFVTQVRPKSDAESKGVKPGDQVLAINGIAPTRDLTWKLQYMFGVLRPQASLKLVLQSPDGRQRAVEAAAYIRETKRLTDISDPDGSDIWNLIHAIEADEHNERTRYAELGEKSIVVKLATFAQSPGEVGELMGKVRKHQAVILDLRGNPGGSVETLEYFAGNLFGKDTKIADLVGRKEHKPMIAKTSTAAYSGKLIVLTDNRSASAAEILARLIQLQKRGVVLGDRSSGSVMQSRELSEKMGTDVNVFYGISVSDADVIMGDGKSLEHEGVSPDELILPTAADLAAGRDPVMSRAAELAGVSLGPVEAGKLFPYEWAPL
jgi:carboxyl-terminal processing protease